MTPTIFVTVLLAAQQTLPPDVLKHVTAATEAQKAGRHDEAIQEFARITALLPELAAAHVNLGIAYVRKGDFTGAIAPLRRALELNGELTGAHQMLGVSLLSAGYAAQAVPHLAKAKVADTLGIALFLSGQPVEAVVQLKAALDQRPDDPDLLYYLGRASSMISKQSFDRLQGQFPTAARTHQLNGEMNATQRKIPEAEASYREALRLRPGLPGAHLQLGELYAAAGQWAKAEAAYRAESQLRPGDAEAVYRLGSALLEQGKSKEALADLKRADELAPNMPETLFALGKAEYLTGGLDAAESCWNRLLTLENQTPLAAQTHFSLASLYRKRGQTEKATAAMAEYRRLRGGQ